MSFTEKEIVFEIHLTALDIAKPKIDDFSSLCRDLGGKALCIELAQGDFFRQPMFTKSIQAENVQTALLEAKDFVQKFKEKSFGISRIKIEIDAKNTDSLEKSPENYFEWHGKIYLTDLQKTLALCEKHKVHLSKNSIKDEQIFRFITLRDFSSKTKFQKRISELKKDLAKNSINIFKETSEFCVFDDNQNLDKGWLPQ